MNKTNIIILILFVITISTTSIFLTKTYKSSQANTSSTNKVLSASKTETKLQTMGAVDIEIIPISLAANSQMIFSISLNTHSVELDYDYLEIIKIRDNLENIYKPIEWTGENSGHHLKGDLLFGELSTDATQIQLIINGIDNENATFSWEVI